MREYTNLMEINGQEAARQKVNYDKRADDLLRLIRFHGESRLGDIHPSTTRCQSSRLEMRIKGASRQLKKDRGRPTRSRKTNQSNEDEGLDED